MKEGKRKKEKGKRNAWIQLFTQYATRNTQANLALAAVFTLALSHARAISLDDIQLWAGSGTNRAALVVEWNSPELLNQTTVPAPVANKTMVWGYRFNGTATGTQMLDAILAADPKLYFMVNEEYGATIVVGIGYNRNGNGVIGLTDGVTTNYFTNGLLTNNDTTFADSAGPINPADLYWGGWDGPNWQVFNETNDSGGFCNSPNRGSSTYWDPNTYNQGQWNYSQETLDDLPLTNGSWIGFSVAAAGYDYSDPSDPANAIANDDGQAPPSPDGTYVAYVPNTNDFAFQVMSTNGIDTSSPYNDPTAALGAPALDFFDPYDGDVTDLVSIIDPPYNVTPSGSNILVEIEGGGEITVQMGRKIYADPHHPYGVDFVVYGYAFFDATSAGAINNGTDLSAVRFHSSDYWGHGAVVSVSQDNTNWFTFTNVEEVFPDEAYRWDDTNASWTEEQMNPTKPLNPYLYTNDFTGETVAGVLDQYTGASGGTGYSLAQVGLPWIKYVRIQPAPGDYMVLDAIAAVDSVVTGDALSIAPDDIAAGTANLSFQSVDDYRQNQVAVGFDNVSGIARVSAVSLSDLSPFAPVEGNVSSAYQIQSLPLVEGPITYTATVGLRAGNGYSGNGSDLRVFEWSCTNWTSEPFTYDASNNEVAVPGVTNFSAFVVSQIVPPVLTALSATNGFVFQLTPVPNCPETLERSTNLMTWTPILTFTATNGESMVLDDSNAPAANAFYRLQLNL
ncbi:MAG TPA: hypothetical protein VMF08_14110 [Candidatus Sulfotelmatobacter sp.]|nr:hypothetical protein [Candidatus Sulfotelmatobacter sp.]